MTSGAASDRDALLRLREHMVFRAVAHDDQPLILRRRHLVHRAALARDDIPPRAFYVLWQRAP